MSDNQASGKPLNWWWDHDRNEHLEHDPNKCCECNHRWWTSRGFDPAVDRMGDLK